MRILMLSSFFLTLSFTVTGVQEASACAPPRDYLMVQVPELSLIVNSPELHAKLRDTGAEAIRSIHMNVRPYRVVASNGCFFEVRPEWQPGGPPGMCPKLAGLTISSAICPVPESSRDTH